MTKLGLVLGGGGARGAAHIGVLLELARLGIQPDLVVGTSIGGLLGALLAAGLSAEDMLDFFQQFNLEQLYRPADLRIPALVSNRRVEKRLEKTIGRPTFADLKLPLAVVATDLVSRQEVVLQAGDVVTAVLATIAIPVALPPVEMGDMILVDGGVKNNTPFNVARQLGADYVLAVDLTNTHPYAPMQRYGRTGPLSKAAEMIQRNELWWVLAATLDVITTQNMEKNLAENPPDLLLRPEIGTIGLFDFHRWQEGVSAGRTAVWQVEHLLVEVIGKR
ncbi:MAG TPA: patatin-like phospholipase family protein [Chloroflexota bacterium]|nr:patatin-like phospholipase family protein [Chloroflexota bacterium]